MPERESLVTVEFKPDGAGTMLSSCTNSSPTSDARDRHQSGWNGALDKMEKFLS